MVYTFEMIQRLVYGMKGDKRYQFYDLLKRNVLLSKNDMENLQNTLIMKLVTHAYSSTKYYRELMDGCNIRPEDIRNKEDLKVFPLLSKSDIRANLKSLYSNDAFSKNLVKVTSGGSTGFQAVIYKSPLFEQFSRAAFLRNNSLVGWNPEDKCVWIWGSPYEHLSMNKSLIAKSGIVINRRLLLNAFNYSLEDFAIWTLKIKEFKPKIIYGYATILLEFSKYLLDKGIRFSSVQICVSTSEVLQEREIIEAAFGCRVYNQYGSREVLAIGIEVDEPGEMVVADDIVVLNIGTDNEIIVTALHSYGFPLINYRLGDCGYVGDIPKKNKNLPFSSMKLTIGRVTDNFINHKGRMISSSAVCTYISTFHPQILAQQIIQESQKDFIINYVPHKTLNESEYKEIVLKVLREYFGADVKTKFAAVNSIPVTDSGKKIMAKRLFDVV